MRHTEKAVKSFDRKNKILLFIIYSIALFIYTLIVYGYGIKKGIETK